MVFPFYMYISPSSSFFLAFEGSALKGGHCHDQFPQIWKGPREPDLAQLLGQVLSHWVSERMVHRGIIDEILAKGK